jgi:NADH dehydrogenase FAD-containing subunit
LPTGADGGLLVNSALQCTEYPDIFGGGDCISFEPCALAKVGVYAVRENHVLLHNLRAFLKKEELKQFDPGNDYLLIFNLGDRDGVLYKKWLRFSGNFAFRIKDYIDSTFMKKFS